MRRFFASSSAAAEEKKKKEQEQAELNALNATSASFEEFSKMKLGPGQGKANRITLLVLGAGDSGKTTFRKQLINVHGDYFQNPEFRAKFRHIILGNLLDGVLEVMAHMGRPSEELSEMLARSREVGEELTPELACSLLDLMFMDEEKGFQKTLKEKPLQIQDCFVHYAQELQQYPAWGGANWVPSIDDCVRSRVRTSGVVAEDVQINGVPFTIYDVGGQRSERRKWMHVFEKTTAAIFVAAISEYDLFLHEDKNKNRMKESMEMYEEVVNSEWLGNTTMMLFLNKKDLFHQKFSVDRIPLNISGCFPDAPTNQDDEQGAIDWIQRQYTSLRVKYHLPTYIHVTTVTDPDNVKKVFKVVTDVIIKQNLKYAGLDD